MSPADDVENKIDRLESSESSRSDHSGRPSQENHEDIEEQLEIEEEGEDKHGLKPLRPALSTANSHVSAANSTIYPAITKTIVSFEPGDPDSPYNWSNRRRAILVAIGIVTVLNSTLGSSIPSGDAPPLQQHFNVNVELQLVLPTSIYLVGYVLGPLIFSPLSEQYGRQAVMLVTFALYTIFTVATCVAPNWAAFNIFRLFCGIFASSPISVIAGLYADLYESPIARGRAMALFMAGTTWGPIMGPVVSGYLGVYGWRYPFWFVLAFAGASWIPLAFLPETYGPAILKRRAKKIRKETGNTNVYAPIELEHTSVRDIAVKVLTRPVRMFFTEWIVLFSCLFLSFIYAIYYMFFQVFPLIYPPIYGFSRGEEGLAFIGIGIGSFFACSIYLWWDAYLVKAKARNAAWAQTEEYRRLPLACMGGPAFTIGMFWIGWAARPDVHWIVPILGGIPLGIGFLLLFMALINYIVDAYEIFAASANAAASCSRSLFGACLPFAGRAMFNTLGVAWACSLLGFISLAFCVVPFIFIRYGDKIRANSKFCQELKQQKAERTEKAEFRRKREAYWEKRKAREKGEEVHEYGKEDV